MSYRGREIEIKLITGKSSLVEVANILRREFVVSRSVFDTSTDTYWHLGEGVRGDFIRMRELEAGVIQVTVKGKDRLTGNLDRIEVELETATSRSVVRNLLTSAHGRPAGTLTKTYHVFWLAGESDHTNVSCYEVSGVVGTYIEVESTNIDKVLELEAQVVEVFGREGIQLARATGSLYETLIVGGT